MRTREHRMEYNAVSPPAVTALTAKNELQYVGSQEVMAMKPPKVVK